MFGGYGRVGAFVAHSAQSIGHQKVRFSHMVYCSISAWILPASPPPHTPPPVSSLQPVSSPPPTATPSPHVALHPLTWELPRLTSIGPFTQVICGGCLQSRSHVLLAQAAHVNILTMLLCVGVMMQRERHASHNEGSYIFATSCACCSC